MKAVRTLLLLTIAATFLVSEPVVGQITRSVDALEDVGIEEYLNAQVPLDLKFRDSSGKEIQLADLFDGDHPVILTLNYSDCPMLCQLQLNGLIDALRELDLDVGEDFTVCSVSIDPLETAQRARLTKQRYVKAYGREGSTSGWRFLIGEKASIDELANAVGFKYKYVPERKEYAHSAALMICTPDGKLSRYLYGVMYPVQTLKLSLVEAGQGKVGSTLDRVILFCFHYDATSGTYAPMAKRMMQLGAGLTMSVLGLVLFPVWLRRRKGSVQPQASSDRDTISGGANA